MPAHRRAAVHLMRIMPSFGGLSWRVAKAIAWRVGGREQIAATFTGCRMQVDVTDFIGTCIYHFGVWEPHLSAFILGRLQPGDVFCDIGAHIGYHTLLAAPVVGEAGKVIAIEPSQVTLEALRRNIEMNAATN